MRRVALAMALALSACASPRRVEEKAVFERRDTLRAVFGEELTVCLDDFRIIPPDSCRPRIEAAQVRVERRREAAVAAAEQVEAVEEQRVVEAPAGPTSSRLWPYCLVGALCFLLGLKVRGGR